MAVVVSYNGFITVNAVDLSNHCKSFKLNDGQDTREVTAHGATQHVFRAGLSRASIEAEFYLDHASGSVEQTLRNLVTIASSGFDVVLRKQNAGSTASNPTYTLTSVVDGDMTVLNETVGEVGMISVKFAPYGTTLSVSSTSS